MTSLRELGFDVLWATESGPGLSDREQARRAFIDGRIAISADYDFAELAVRGIEQFVGLVMLAPDLEMEGAATKVLAARIAKELHRCTGSILIFDSRRVRERPL